LEDLGGGGEVLLGAGGRGGGLDRDSRPGGRRIRLRRRDGGLGGGVEGNRLAGLDGSGFGGVELFGIGQGDRKSQGGEEQVTEHGKSSRKEGWGPAKYRSVRGP